ncbi:leucine-rich repeat-containing protein [Tanacetum coccineum]
MLKGTIHPNNPLFNLRHLQKLNLAFNDIGGSQIPSEIGRFSNSLTHLNFSGCDFSGQVPPNITVLHKLVSLGLSANPGLKLIPHVFIKLIHNATSCEELSLQNVNISSVLPTSLNISSSLKLLDLHDTGLQGKLPHYLFNLHSLETLDLSANSFIGNIPSEISVDITNITFLNLAINKLNGTLPSWLFTSPSLKRLHLSHNMLSGNVPFESFALPSLKYLHLGNNNQLVGHIDMQTFLKLTNLTELGLSYNKFSGEWQLDTLLITLTKLEYLDLSYSGLSVRAKNANHYVNPGFNCLGLASCKLKNGYFGSGNLEGLRLNGNQLEGEVPHSLSKCRSLKVLDLGNNKLNGTFPEWLGGLSNLQGLCGFPLSNKLCERLSSPHAYGDGDEEEVDESGFTWKVVMLGYGSGTLAGLVMGYLMLSTRKVKWFNTISDATESLVLKKMKTNLWVSVRDLRRSGSQPYRDWE